MSGANTYIYAVKSIGLSERKDPVSGKKRKPQSLLTAARHNLREIQAENGADYGKVDPTRIHLNEVLAGPDKASEVEGLNHQLFAAAGIDRAKLRKDHAQASEHVISLEAGQDERGFFSLMVAFFKRVYGAENILSATVHRDQKQAHIHILISPISGGSYQGGKLHDKKRTEDLKRMMAEEAKTIGFAPPSGKFRRQQTSDKAAAVIACLEHYQHPILNDAAWPAWLKTISTDPSPLFEFYQLDTVIIPKSMSQERLRKSEKTTLKPIAMGTATAKGPYLPSVDIGHQPTPKAPPAPAHRSIKGTSLKAEQHEAEQPGQQAAEVEQIERIRDCDFPADSFDPDTGEFFEAAPQPSNRAATNKTVNQALAELSSRKQRNDDTYDIPVFIGRKWENPAKPRTAGI
jgi:hypothetical protein